MERRTIVVKVTDASKRFVIRKEKSLKERVVNFGRSNRFKQDFWALRHVNLEIDSGSTVGLIGPNGSGKSTLLKLIGGVLQPTTGQVERRGRLAALIELGAGFHPDLTGRENIYLNSSLLGLSKTQTQRQFDAIVDFSGVEEFIDTQVKFYSSGMYVRLAFAVAVHVDPDVLLVDEVLAVGDEPFQRKCMDRIRSFQRDGRTIILVTHSFDQVAELCDRAVVLEHGRVQVDGDPREALRHLRTDFDAMREEERERERHDRTAQTATRARVASVNIVDDSGQRLDAIKPGDALTVCVDVDADEPLQRWILGISIETPLGQIVYGTNTKLLGLSLPPVSGRRQFKFRLPELWLGEGPYALQAAIAEGSGVEIHRLSDAATLHVESNGQSIGYLHARPELSAD
jgi:ABC-type polysaccharide/polyol phosphate transport system ATPase subunit